MKELDLSNFDTCNVTNMDYMFYGYTNLEHIIYVGENWTTLDIEDDSNMFGSCTELPNFDDTYKGKTNAYVGRYLECKSGLACTCTYSGC